MSDTDDRPAPATPLRYRLQQLLGGVLGKRFDRVLAGIDEGQLTMTWPDGSATRHGRHSPIPGHDAHVVLHNFRPIRQMMLGGEVGFAESYLRGDWSADDLIDLFSLVMRNERAIADATGGSRAARTMNALRHALNRNSERGSRRNIAFHYDLGNDFYRLWLDPSMSYSSALFEAEDEPLATAQARKLDRVATLLAPARGARVLEIGCGWGALAHRLAAGEGCRVEGISLSDEQLDWARERHALEPRPAVGGRGSGSTSFRLRDYRSVAGRYDHVVSIEMFEAVGERYWRTYFDKLAELLDSGGTAVLQVITILEERFETYRSSPDFIQRYIFPGGMLPSKTHLIELADAAGLDLVRSEWFGASYARTLQLWRERFEQVSREVRAQGFDERFLRMWRYYLAYCEAGFRHGSTDVGLLVFAKRAESVPEGPAGSGGGMIRVPGPGVPSADADGRRM